MLQKAAAFEEFGAIRIVTCQVNLMTMSKVFIMKEILLSCSVSMCVCELFFNVLCESYVLMQCDCFPYYRMYHNNWQVDGFLIFTLQFTVCAL